MTRATEDAVDAEIIDGAEPHALALRDSFLPAVSLDAARERYEAFRAFVQTQMTVGVDYGKIPGTPKPTLYKPGAEKICTLFGLSQRAELQDKVEDWQGGLVFYRYKVALWRGDVLIAEAEGSCNSREKKYEKRTVFDIANTVLKMAFKRALVAAALVAGNASEFFVQDLEDQAPAPTRANAATPEQLAEIERLAALVPIAPDEASMKATGMPVAELQTGSAQRLVGLLMAKLKQQEADRARAEEPRPAPVSADDRTARELLLKDLAAKADVPLKTALEQVGKANPSDLSDADLDHWIVRMKRRIAEREKRPLASEQPAAAEPERISRDEVRTLNALWSECKLGDGEWEEFEANFGVSGLDAVEPRQLEQAMTWIRERRRAR